MAISSIVLDDSGFPCAIMDGIKMSCATEIIVLTMKELEAISGLSNTWLNNRMANAKIGTTLRNGAMNNLYDVNKAISVAELYIKAALKMEEAPNIKKAIATNRTLLKALNRYVAAKTKCNKQELESA